MLEFSGGCFSVRLIRELDVFSVFVSFFGGASYMRVRLICANIRYSIEQSKNDSIVLGVLTYYMLKYVGSI